MDDDRLARKLLGRILEREGYACSPAKDIGHGWAQLADDPFDLVLCDVRLPDGSGVDFVQEALGRHAGMAALMVSGLNDTAIAERAIAAGAYGYVVKPFTANEVLIGVYGALRHRRAGVAAEDGLLKATNEEMLQRLGAAVEARDPETAPHIRRMSEYCCATARKLGFSAEQCELIRIAAPMHDVGKIAVPDRVLLKPGPLSGQERLVMERHAEVGYRILAGSPSRLLQLAATIAWTHHEHVDGTGYPRGLSDESIPAVGRIAAVADVYDALTRDRVYRPRFQRDDALEMLHEQRGRHFDPEVLDAFLEVI